MELRATIYETMGGGDAVLALASAWHERCLAFQLGAHIRRSMIAYDH